VDKTKNIRSTLPKDVPFKSYENQLTYHGVIQKGDIFESQCTLYINAAAICIKSAGCGRFQATSDW